MRLMPRLVDDRSMSTRHRRILLRLLMALACAHVTAAWAQEASYPVRPVHIVVPTSPGGVTDILGRALAQRFADIWRAQFIVENRAGAYNIIGAEYVARAAHDGYTLMVSSEGVFVSVPYVYASLPFDSARDFEPVSGLARINQALIASNSLPAKDVRELLEMARGKPGTLTYGSFGTASSGHLNMEMPQSMAGVKFIHVPYKGSTPAFADVVAGHIAMMFVSTGSAVPPWRAGKVKILAVGSAHRLPQLPEVPTVAENGLPGFEATSWFGMFAPGGTPRDIVAKLNAETQRILADPGFREKLLAPQMLEPMTGSPEQFAEFIRAEAVKWSKVVRDAKVKLE